MSGMTYKQAGVDIDEGDRFVRLISPLVKKTFRPEVMTDIGSFGGLFSLDTSKYKNPVLVSGTDGVGTKLKVAFKSGIHNTVGIDLVAMCVNDIITSGAEPLFFLDYFATGKLSPEAAATVIEGIVEGCRQAGCSLIGGETAEMPGFYADGEYDLSGFAVGVVDRDQIVNGSTVEPGDAVVGVASSGVHSNGFSLVRKVLFEMAGLKTDQHIEELGTTLGQALLAPTIIYVKAAEALKKLNAVKAMAHITGGGLPGNLPRAFPEHLDARLDLKSWPVPPVFEYIRKLGQVPQEDMMRTFNMGIGFIFVVKRDLVNKTLETLNENGYHSYAIGTIEKGTGKVVYGA